MRSFLTPAFNVIGRISLSSVLPLLALAGAFPQRIPAQDNIIVTSSPPAAMALERFIAEQPAHSRTPVESIEIEVSLPKLNKNADCAQFAGPCQRTSWNIRFWSCLAIRW
jgi:hypothetical protein